MNIHVVNGPAKGIIYAPSSKSIVHRMLICGALSSGKSIIKNVDMNDDILTTINCLRALGAVIEISNLKDNNKIFIRKKVDFNIVSPYLEANQSASTLRFLMPLCLLFKNKIVFNMSEGLAKRPHKIYEDLFYDSIKREENDYIIHGSLKSGFFDIKGDVSSQFISGLMFALPLLKFNSRIRIIPPFSSSSYVDMTIACLKKAGVIIKKENDLEFFIKGNQTYKSFEEEIEGDYSSISNILALGALNGHITIHNLTNNSIQGDRRIINYLVQMNANIISINDGFKVNKSDLNGIDVDVDDNIDLSLILIALCSLINDTSYIRNVARLKYKETSRLECLLDELNKIGLYYEMEDNYLRIYGGINSDGGMTVKSHGDHRICMALCIIGTCLKNGLTIEDAGCVSKSYPNFFKDLETLGIKFYEEESI